MRSLSRRRRGYTMVELVVVVIVIGMSMAIVAPRFRISAFTEVQLAGTQLAQDIDVTRTRALTTRQMSRVAFDQSGRRYGGFLDHNDDGIIGQVDVEWQDLRGFGLRTLPPRITYGRGAAPAIPDDAGGGAVTFADSRVQFDSRGLVIPQGASGVIYLRHETDANAVVALAVAPSGNVRLWTWRASEGWK